MAVQKLISSKPIIYKNVSKAIEKINWHNVSISFENDMHAKVFDEFKINKPIIGDLFVGIEKLYEQAFNRFKIQIKNKFGKSLGTETLDISLFDKSISGQYMEVKPEYRRRENWRLGEVMRLASVMELLENQGSAIKIFSKNSAVYFHSRYKFKPCITQFYTRDKNLEFIANDKAKGFEHLATKAKEYIKLIENNKRNHPLQRSLTVSTNELINEYIELALKSQSPEKLHPFEWGVDMMLTREDVLKNKDFFNKLFENQGINYKI